MSDEKQVPDSVQNQYDFVASTRHLDAEQIEAMFAPYLAQGTSREQLETALIEDLREQNGKLLPVRDAYTVLVEKFGPPAEPAPKLAPPAPEQVRNHRPYGYDLVAPSDGAILHCAALVHAAVEGMNKVYNEATLDWDRSKASLVAGINRIIENPAETPEQNHNEWMKFRASEGWVYGPIKDMEKKTHPCMVPYSALGPFQQSKDSLFLSIVRTYFGLEGA